MLSILLSYTLVQLSQMKKYLIFWHISNTLSGEIKYKYQIVKETIPTKEPQTWRQLSLLLGQCFFLSKLYDFCSLNYKCILLKLCLSSQVQFQKHYFSILQPYYSYQSSCNYILFCRNPCQKVCKRNVIKIVCMKNTALFEFQTLSE